MHISFLLAVVLAYLLGSLSFAVIVSRFMGLNDPRSYGSGNPGATNVLRSGNKKAALLTLVFDALKGWLPVFVVSQWGAGWGLGAGALACVGLAAFLGHLYPVFFRFQGGKGVATAAGVVLAWAPLAGTLVLLTWLLVAFVSRYSSFAALVAALSAPMWYMLGINGWWPVQGPVLFAIVGVSGLLIWRHRANIRRLLDGQESRIGSKGSSSR